jgi:hypothetical protein
MPAIVEVLIRTNAWADVFADGESLGRVPHARGFHLAAGPHKLRFTSPFIEPRELVAVIPAHGPVRLSYKLVLKKKTIHVSLKSPAQLQIEGRTRHVARTATLDLPYGEHEIRIMRDGATVSTRSLMVSPTSPSAVSLE